MYCYKIKGFDNDEEREFREQGFVRGSNYTEAVQTLEGWFKGKTDDPIYSIVIYETEEVIDSYDILEFAKELES